MTKTGAFVRTGGKWTPTIVDPQGDVIVIGEYGTRDEAKKAYIQKHRELYQPVAAPVVDPDRQDSLLAGDILTSPFQSTTLH